MTDQSGWPAPWPPKPDMTRERLKAYARVVGIETTGVWAGWDMVCEGMDAKDAIVRQFEGEPAEEPTFSGTPGNRIWDGILLIIAHSAALSRMLFPQLPSNTPVEKYTSEQRARHERGRQLRTWLQIADDSPLNTAGRELRNTIEHWDEKIDQWFLNDSAGKHVIALMIGANPPPWAEPEKEYYIRFYDHPTGVVMVGHVKLELHPLLTEVATLEDNFRQVRSDLMSDKARARYRTPPR